MLFDNPRTKKNSPCLKWFMLFFIVFYFSFTGLAVQMEDIEAAWQSRGYNIRYEDHLKILELSFEFSNVLSLDEQAKELYIITYLTREMPQPDEQYLSDIEKVLTNSSFSEQIMPKISETMTLKNTWETDFWLTERIQVTTFLYDSTTPIIKFSFFDEPRIADDPIQSEKDNELTAAEDSINLLTAELKEKEDENLHLKLDNQALVNINAVLNNTNSRLTEEVEKYKNLSEYRDRTISGLKATVDRYIDFEKQKDNTIQMLENQIRELEQDIVDNHDHYQSNLKALENEIHTLKLTIQKQLVEIEWLEDTHKQLLERINQLKTLQAENTEQAPINKVHEQSDEPIILVPPVETTVEIPATESIMDTPTIVEDPAQDNENEKEELRAADTEKMNQSEPVPLLKAIVIYENGKKVHTIQHQYNEHRNLVKELFLDSNDEIVGFSETLYDATNRIKEKRTYEGQVMMGKVIIQYDENDRMVRQFNYNQDSLMHYSVYEYDEAIAANEPIMVKHYSNNRLTAYDENEYNERGQLLRSTQKSPEGTTLSQAIYNYQQEKLIRITFLQASKQTGYQVLKYADTGLQIAGEIYDANGRCISQLVFIWDEES